MKVSVFVYSHPDHSHHILLALFLLGSHNFLFNTELMVDGIVEVAPVMRAYPYFDLAVNVKPNHCFLNREVAKHFVKHFETF